MVKLDTCCAAEDKNYVEDNEDFGRNDFGRRGDEERLGPNECQRVRGISAVLPQ